MLFPALSNQVCCVFVNYWFCNTLHFTREAPLCLINSSYNWVWMQELGYRILVHGIPTKKHGTSKPGRQWSWPILSFSLDVTEKISMQRLLTLATCYWITYSLKWVQIPGRWITIPCPQCSFCNTFISIIFFFFYQSWGKTPVQYLFIAYWVLR